MSTTELQIGVGTVQDGDMTVHYLSKKQFAARVGLEGKEGALDSLKMPKPDAIIGEGPRATRGWLPETADRWNEMRPGRGRRWESDPAEGI
ncbi:transcriptional regulator [Leucobacter allii]|uniref:transcriptional regulator n=1 Tax=Leucobacter allii TaxID=2932247 RepID=UPI001FD31AF3|nr:transcriptional regulator [Leucobacter allii]UOR02082.1 transcriptional regulator [Leucobacter allii]